MNMNLRHVRFKCACQRDRDHLRSSANRRGFLSGRQNKQSKPTISYAVVPNRHVVPSEWYHLCLVLDVKIIQTSPLQRGLFAHFFQTTW